MIRNSITAQFTEVISKHSFGSVLLNRETNEKAFFAEVSILPGDFICKFGGGITTKFPTYLTVQIGADTHVTFNPEFLQYINHGCDPNVFFDTTAMEMICLKAVQPGDELSFFYPSTEWDMAQPFVCNCGSPTCLQLISGASHLSVETLSKYKLNNFIRQQVRQKLSL